MRVIGLTGGIGSGKSSVSALLATRGAVIVDADAIVRELQAAGQPVLEAMVVRWGSEILDDSGELDRQTMAGIVFSDAEQLKELEAIVHPALRSEIRSRIELQAQTDNVVVLDMALLVERGQAAYDVGAVVVVDCPTSITTQRLVTHRGFSPDDAAARIGNQVSRDQRLAIADYVIDNSGTPEELEQAVAGLWDWLEIY